MTGQWELRFFRFADSQQRSADVVFDPAADVCPLLSPDGTRIVFSSFRGGKQQLYQKLSSGAGSDEMLLPTEYNAFADDWTTTAKDGAFILYEFESQQNRFDLYVFAADPEPYEIEERLFTHCVHPSLNRSDRVTHH